MASCHKRNVHSLNLSFRLGSSLSLRQDIPSVAKLTRQTKTTKWETARGKTDRILLGLAYQCTVCLPTDGIF